MTEMNGVYCSTKPMCISAAIPKKTIAITPENPSSSSWSLLRERKQQREIVENGATNLLLTKKKIGTNLQPFWATCNLFGQPAIPSHLNPFQSLELFIKISYCYFWTLAG